MPNHYYSLEAAQLNGIWLTIGVFDGVHRGHQEIVQQLTAGAHANGAPAVVLTFAPHPAIVLAGRDIKSLTTPDERAEILFSLGINDVITIEFTRELAEHSAEDFMADLKHHLGLKKLLIGYDFALGKGRAGNFERLTQIGKDLDYDVSAVAAVRLNNEIVSSTLIRQQIAEGAVALAADKLGRCYSVAGPVVPGDGRGRTIGIPTTNIDVPAEKVIPLNGVYACRALVDGKKHRAVVNIGVRPTFTGGDVLPRVEAHLLDYSSDLYGKTVTLEFVERLRGEQKFSSVDALVTQIRIDIEKAKELLQQK
jgi:riboflavin kinase / FMN adenylyltransferase